MKDKEFTFKNVHNITAGAGAGKTTELVNKITKLVIKGQPANRMILTTFTKAAANEFRERCKAALIKEGELEASVEMDAAMMGTVHSLAERYIGRYWYLLGMSPEVKPMDESAMGILKNRAFENDKVKKASSLFNQYVITFGIADEDGYNTNFWQKTLLELSDLMDKYGIEDLKESKEYTLGLINEIFTQKANADLIKEMHNIAVEYKSYKVSVEASAKGEGYERYVTNCGKIDSILELCEGELTIEDIKKIGDFGFGRKIEGPADADALDAVREKLLELQKRMVKELVPKEVPLYEEVAGKIFDLAPECREEYRKIKEAYGVIDFDDMEKLFLKLLDKEEVKEDIRKSIDYLFVDEFQDSNPIQVRIFEKLAGLVKQSYFVGDRKQTIYGFRGSDAELIWSITNIFPEVEEDRTSPIGYKKDEKGNSSQILGTSHRSLPQLVHAANEIFVPAFDETINGYEADQIAENQVRLEPYPEMKDKEYGGLYHVQFPADCEPKDWPEALAAFVCRMISDPKFEEAGYKPSDIAILTRVNGTIATIADALSRRNVKVDYLDEKFQNAIEVALVVDILKLSDGIDRDLTRAEIRKMLQKETLEELVSKINKNENKLEELAALEQFAVGLRGLSVSERIQTIIAQLDLYDFVQRWSDSMTRRNRLNILREAASKYETMGQVFATPVDVRGYVAYLSKYKVDAKFDNSSDGVKVLNYHKSKGLEWKIVIMYELDKANDDKATLSGVRFAHQEGNKILALPQLPKKDWVGKCINQNKVSKALIELKQAKDGGEEKRLLYVGFTRAKEVVITVGNGNELEKITKYCPTARGLNGEVKDGMIDIWGPEGLKSRLIEQPADPDCETRLEASGECVCYNGIAVLPLKHKGGKRVDFEGLSTRKYHSPSQYRDEAAENETEVKEVMIWDKGATRIEANELSDDELGNCIHHIYGACKPGADEFNRGVAETTLTRYGIDKGATDFVVESIKRLYDFLEKTYGPVTSVDCELPFSYKDDEGHVFNGTIDMLWNTNEGSVIIDHKTFSGDTKLLEETNSKFYPTKYASQLRLYKAALTSAGYTVKALLLHYPIQNRVIELRKKD